MSALSFDCLRCRAAVTLHSVAQVDALVCAVCAARYDVQDGIVLLEHGADEADYPASAYAHLAAVEQRHFWFAARNRVVLAVLRSALGSLPGRSVLDVGCGTGFVLAALERAGLRACGLDMHLAGLRIARQRVAAPLLCARRAPFRDEFDAVTLCDVIEHASDDAELLSEAARAARQDGVLLVTVPANPRLWGAVDEVSGHRRRYTAGRLRATIERAGLHPRVVRYFNSLLLPAQLLARARFRRAPAHPRDADHVLADALAVPPAPLNALLTLAASADLVLRLRLPFGASLVAVATRV